MRFSQPLKFIFILFLLVLLNKVLPDLLGSYRTHLLLMIGINLILVLSLNLINGITGQFSIGHAGFMAVGAYGSAMVSLHFKETLLNTVLFWLPTSLGEVFVFLIALLSGGFLACFAGLIVGIPTLRLKGDYLAIATLGFGEIIRVVIVNIKSLGGALGLDNIPRSSNFFWIYLFVILTLLFIRNLTRSYKGSALLAIREDEIAAESVGIDTARYKVIAFAIGAFFAGIGGGLLAHIFSYITPDSFSFLKSIELIVMVVLGGMGSLTGSILSVIVLTLLPEVLRGMNQWRMVLYSLLLVVMMLIRPQGILGSREIRFLKR